MHIDAADLAVRAETAEVEVETRAVDGTTHRTSSWVVDGPGSTQGPVHLRLEPA